MRTTQPLFRFDPGWLFITAGLVLCVAGVLLPAQRDLFALNQQLEDLRRQEQHLNERLHSHAKFLSAFEADHPVLTKRLAAVQLNLAPAGDTPVLLASGRTGAVADWIEAKAPPPPASQAKWPDSILSRLATGPYRLWLIGGSVLCVFMGLLTTSMPVRSRQEPDNASEHDAEDAAADELQGIDEGSSAMDGKDDEWIDGESDEADACEIVTQPTLPASHAARWRDTLFDE